MPLGADNGALRLTTARYFTPSGRSIQAKGIEPDDHRWPKFPGFLLHFDIAAVPSSCEVIDLYGTSFRSASLFSLILSLREAANRVLGGQSCFAQVQRKRISLEDRGAHLHPTAATELIKP